jgi:hypothetical protein
LKNKPSFVQNADMILPRKNVLLNAAQIKNGTLSELSHLFWLFSGFILLQIQQAEIIIRVNHFPQQLPPKNNSSSNTKTTTDTPVELNTAFVADDYGEITIQRVDFTDDVLPDKPSRFYSHYAADPDKVYLCVTATIKNMQKKSCKSRRYCKS